jgi:alanine racemase
MANAWATVDLDAIAANVDTLVRLVAPSAVCAVVKADGYGHGAVPVARAALEAGASWLAVAHVGEGERLREAGLDAPVLVLSEPEPSDFGRLVDAGLEVTLFSAAGVDAAAAAAARGPLRAHLKVDTGMHRVGAQPDEVVPLARRIADTPGLELAALWTHLAVADEPDDPFTELQLRRYREALAALEAEGLAPPLRHAANSAGAIGHPEARFDLVRCGIAVYGLPPSPALDGVVPLRPAMSLCARVSHVKTVAAGDAISYGQRHRFDHDARVATVTIGYADGVRRDLFQRGGEVLLHGTRCPIVGTVTMDQIMVECGDLPVQVGDEAVLFGTQGGATISVDEVAERLDTIAYEVICGVGPRVERRCVRSGR